MRCQILQFEALCEFGFQKQLKNHWRKRLEKLWCHLFHEFPQFLKPFKTLRCSACEILTTTREILKYKINLSTHLVLLMFIKYLSNRCSDIHVFN